MAEIEHRCDRKGQLDRSVCGSCGDAFVECSRCGVYGCTCTTADDRTLGLEGVIAEAIEAHRYMPCTHHTPTVSAWWAQCKGCDWRGPRRSVRGANEADHYAHRAAHVAERVRAHLAPIEALADEPVAPYPAECACSHGMGFQFHRHPCRYAREIPKADLRAVLAATIGGPR